MVQGRDKIHLQRMLKTLSRIWRKYPQSQKTSDFSPVFMSDHLWGPQSSQCLKLFHHLYNWNIVTYKDKDKFWYKELCFFQKWQFTVKDSPTVIKGILISILAVFNRCLFPSCVSMNIFHFPQDQVASHVLELS